MTLEGKPAPTALVADPVYKEHVTGAGHPERPERYKAVASAIRKAGLESVVLRVEQRPATEDELALCHRRPYIDLVRREVAAGARELSTGDTNVCPRSLDVALRAAGGVLNAVDAVMTGRARTAFCVVRPPGHHARPDQGMGFCLFNNVAIAARYAQRRHGVERVLIADWDVHHGNGTQDIFYTDGSVFFFSTHQHPWYPGTGRPEETGAGAGKGTTLNCPFPAGSGAAEIVGAFRQKLLPAAQAFRSGPGDDLGRLRLAPGRSAGPVYADRRRLRRTHASDARNGRYLRARTAGVGARRRIQSQRAGLGGGGASAGVGQCGAGVGLDFTAEHAEELPWNPCLTPGPLRCIPGLAGRLPGRC